MGHSALLLYIEYAVFTKQEKRFFVVRSENGIQKKCIKRERHRHYTPICINGAFDTSIHTKTCIGDFPKENPYH